MRGAERVAVMERVVTEAKKMVTEVHVRKEREAGRSEVGPAGGGRWWLQPGTSFSSSPTCGTAVDRMAAQRRDVHFTRSTA